MLEESVVPTEGIEQLFTTLHSSKEGLSPSDAAQRLATYGPNRIEEKKESVLFKLLRYFWGPIPWMIEVAIILSAVLHHWSNLIIIVILLLVNGLVGFFEEFQAGNAIAALKKNLALRSLVKRGGSWTEIEASKLVPGDVIRIRLGNIIPADARLFDGDYLSVDQSTLTGESLPVAKKAGDLVYSGSIAKQGEMEALVVSTGQNTFFGKTAKLVGQACPVSHFQRAVLQIGRYLIYISLALALVLMVSQVLRGDRALEVVQFVLILIVASIPVAMPAVLSMTMALGALRLSRMKAIVTRLESIEEMAGVDVLCCDKTGTLTQNRLKLEEPVSFQGQDPEALLLCGCLASKAENQDPIDLAILNGLVDGGRLKDFKQIKFIPFNPVDKRTEATVIAPEGNTFYVTKGAPQVILELCCLDAELKDQVESAISALAEKGYRTLGVASSGDGKATWQFLGLLSLSDPPREDAKETIAQAGEHGIRIKMLTGDHSAIAREIAHQLGVGDQIVSAGELFSKSATSSAIGDAIDKSNGFAQVFPEHKYNIIQLLQARGHIVAMTGDGVNDSPALKQADVGIAVSGATDAARAAASLVLTAPGLAVVVKAIEEARRIFERMNSYAIYRITETIRIMLFIVSCILAYNFYPITALMIILLALLNDLPIMTIVYDHTVLATCPVRWKMKRVLTIATALGCLGVVGSFVLIAIARAYFDLTLEQLQSLIFLKLSIAGHQTLFVVRARHAFFSRPYPSPILLTAILSTQVIAALIVGFGILIPSIPWIYIGYLWGYTLVWMFLADGLKNLIYKWLYTS